MAKLQKLANHDNTAMTAATALKLATLGNAEVLGLEKVTGSLEVGKEADLVAIDLNQPHLTPVHDVVSSLVYSASGTEVTLTMCGGQILYQNGKFKTLDWPKIKKAAEALRTGRARSSNIETATASISHPNATRIRSPFPIGD